MKTVLSFILSFFIYASCWAQSGQVLKNESGKKNESAIVQKDGNALIQETEKQNIEVEETEHRIENFLPGAAGKVYTIEETRNTPKLVEEKDNTINPE